MKTKLLSKSAFCLATIFGFSQSSATAQEAASGAGQAGIDDRHIDLIIVTSQKREQTLLDVPVSVTALSGDALRRSAITDITEIVNLVPGFDFTRTQETRNAGFRVRGVGTQTFNEGVIGSVGTVVDGVTLGRQAQGLNNLIDIERVEVLRGPQGTLFGASTTAGLVNIVTKAPTDEFEGMVDLEYGSFNTYKVRGSMSGPIAGDAVTGRLTGYVTGSDGHGGENVLTGEDINGRDEFGFRGKLNIEASDTVNLLFIADVSSIDSECCEPTLRSGTSTFGFFEDGFANEGNRDTITDGQQMSETQDTWGLSLTADIEIGSHTLTSVSSYRDWELSAGLDIDSIPSNFLNFAGTDNATEEVQQELRITSPDDQDFRYIGGIYYFKQDLERFSEFTGAFLGALGGAELTETQDITYSLETLAFFGQANYDLTEKWEVYGGLRYTDMSMEVDHLSPAGTGFVAPLNIVLVPKDYEIDHSDAGWSGTLGAKYKISDDATFFASYTRGYKGIALNIEGGPLTQAEIDADPDALRVDAETVDSYEVGFKSYFNDRRVNINGSIFYSAFDNFHSNSFDPETNSNILSNAGGLTTQGAELEVFARLTNNFDISAAVAYIDATFDDFQGAPCYSGQTVAEGCVDGFQDLSGKQLNNSPEWFLSGSVQYTSQFLNTDWESFVRGEISYRTEVFTNVNQDPLAVQDGYALLNASVGLTSPDAKYRLSLFGKNLTDENYAYNIQRTLSQVGIDGGTTHFLAPPATWGVSLAASF